MGVRQKGDGPGSQILFRSQRDLARLLIMDTNTAIDAPTVGDTKSPTRRVRPSRVFPGILVVESNPDLQWRIARTLTVRGHRVVGTSSGDGALALMREWPVDLVLTDLDLPGMSASNLISKLRAEHPELPVIFMVNAAEDGPPLPMVSNTASLKKPFTQDDLISLVEWLSAKSQTNPVLLEE